MSTPPDRIEGEREASEVANARPRMKVGHSIALFGLGAGVFIAFVFYRDAAKKPPEVKPPATQIGMVVPAPPPPAAAPIVPVLAQPAPWARPEPPPQSLAAALPSTGPKSDAPAPRRMLSYGGGATPAAASAPAAAPSPAAPPAVEQTGMAWKAGRVPGIKAGPAMDMTYVLEPGVVKITLDHGIDTTQPGPIFAHLTEDVRSRYGVVLMEKGTRITGSYGSNIQQGQARLPAMTAFAITPNGVPVALSAPMGDALGRAGFPGEVDNHTMARFGGALLLLAAQGSIQVAQSALQGQGRGNSYTNLNIGGVEGAVTEVLRNTVNIAPTITVAQGSEIAILVTQPIDFSDAYELRSTR